MKNLSVLFVSLVVVTLTVNASAGRSKASTACASDLTNFLVSSTKDIQNIYFAKLKEPQAINGKPLEATWNTLKRRYDTYAKEISIYSNGRIVFESEVYQTITKNDREISGYMPIELSYNFNYLHNYYAKKRSTLMQKIERLDRLIEKIKKQKTIVTRKQVVRVVGARLAQDYRMDSKYAWSHNGRFFPDDWDVQRYQSKAWKLLEILTEISRKWSDKVKEMEPIYNYLELNAGVLASIKKLVAKVETKPNSTDVVNNAELENELEVKSNEAHDLREQIEDVEEAILKLEARGADTTPFQHQDLVMLCDEKVALEEELEALENEIEEIQRALR